MEKIIYPIRINKYLALKSVCSRREADALISAGKIKINGQRAKLGDKVFEQDKISVEGNRKKIVYFVLNKPNGIITHSPQKNEKSINDMVRFPEKVFPLGRLDKNSRGLIILTNDGRATDRLLNPASNHEKEYEVRVDRLLKESFLRKMSSGVVLDDGQKTKKCQIRKRGEKDFSIILTEGKNRQIRRMCETLGYHVVDLNRTRIMNVQLGNLKLGQFRKLADAELADFLAALGL